MAHVGAYTRREARSYVRLMGTRFREVRKAIKVLEAVVETGKPYEVAQADVALNEAVRLMWEDVGEVMKAGVYGPEA